MGDELDAGVANDTTFARDLLPLVGRQVGCEPDRPPTGQPLQHLALRPSTPMRNSGKPRELFVRVSGGRGPANRCQRACGGSSGHGRSRNTRCVHVPSPESTTAASIRSVAPWPTIVISNRSRWTSTQAVTITTRPNGSARAARSFGWTSSASPASHRRSRSANDRGGWDVANPLQPYAE